MYRLFAQCPVDGFTVSMVLGNRNAIRVGLLGSSRAGFHQPKVETENCEPIMMMQMKRFDSSLLSGSLLITMMVWLVPVYRCAVAQWQL